MAGVQVGGIYGAQNYKTNPVTSVYRNYNTAGSQDSGVNDELMQNYRNLLAQTPGSPTNTSGTGNIRYNPITVNYKAASYTPTSDYTSSFRNLQDLSTTGGFSGSDINNLRERGISPIRAAYAGADREVDRSRSLQGGFGPAYGALKAKMAREKGAEMADQMSKTNADIAENVTKNKMAASSQAASLAAEEQANRNRFNEDENARMNDFAMQTAGMQNDAAKFNFQLPGMNTNNVLSILNAIRDQYSTTPGRTNMFGNTALNTTNMVNGIRQNNNNRILSMYGGA